MASRGGLWTRAGREGLERRARQHWCPQKQAVGRSVPGRPFANVHRQSRPFPGPGITETAK